MNGDDNNMKYYPCECSINNYISCSEFVFDGVSKSGLINDRNCFCCPILCGIAVVFDIFTCIPFSVYTSYKKCKNCNCKKNKITIITIDTQPKYNNYQPK